MRRPGRPRGRSVRRRGASGPAAGVAARRESPIPSRETPAAAPAGTPRYGAFATRGPAPSSRPSKDPRSASSRLHDEPPAPDRSSLPLPRPGAHSAAPRPPRTPLPPQRPLLQPCRVPPVRPPPHSTQPPPLLQPGLPPSPPQPPAPGPLSLPQGSARSRPRPAKPPAAFLLFAPRRGSPASLAPGAGSRAGGGGKALPSPAAGFPPAQRRSTARPGSPGRRAEVARKEGRRVLRALKGERPSSSPAGEGGRAEPQREQHQTPALPGSSSGLYAPGWITARPGEEGEGAAA